MVDESVEQPEALRFMLRENRGWGGVLVIFGRERRVSANSRESGGSLLTERDNALNLAKMALLSPPAFIANTRSLALRCVACMTWTFFDAPPREYRTIIISNISCICTGGEIHQ